MSVNEFNPKRCCMELILDYEVYDEDGSCVPYFTGRITDAEGRVICQAENEERATELVGYVKVLHSDYAALLARHNALREAVAWEKECAAVTLPDAYYHYPDNRKNRIVNGHGELRRLRDCVRDEVDRLLGEEK